jgi:hypothetical protein
MTGRQPYSPLDACFSRTVKEIFVKSVFRLNNSSWVENLAISMDLIHKQVASMMKSRDRKRKKLNANVKPYKFGLGDFVFVTVPNQKISSKLKVLWSGPQRITDVISDWVFKWKDADRSCQ